MIDLQTSLIVIGGMIVAGVISYNKWQERKTRQTVERAFSSSHDDVLMNADAQSHFLATTSPTPAYQTLAEGGIATLPPSMPGERLEPELYERLEPAPHPPLHLPFPESGPGESDLPVDKSINCLIPIALERPVRGEKILTGVQNLCHAGDKSVRFVGRTQNDVWEAIGYGGVYTALLAGVQLANRNSALNELEYSDLIMRLREFTDAIGAEPEIPDMIDVMKTAQALHQFIMDHDVQLGVNVRSNGAPWHVDTLLSALTRQGFERRADGRLVMPDGVGETLFSLSTNTIGAVKTTNRLTLLLDVPRVAPSRDGYGAMIACARSLAMRLDGTVVDDSGQLLSDAALSNIAEQVSAFYSAMESAQIPAGSKRAACLFS
jgi:hypothetical protein